MTYVMKENETLVSDEVVENTDLTPLLNERSIEYVRSMINRKNGSVPFYSNGEDVKMSITDYDHFPYTRYFRGVPESSRPIVAEREAGWRPRQNTCYTVNTKVEKKPVNYCFQVPCSTTLPCIPTNECRDKEKYANRECVIQYR